MRLCAPKALAALRFVPELRFLDFEEVPFLRARLLGVKSSESLLLKNLERSCNEKKTKREYLNVYREEKETVPFG